MAHILPVVLLHCNVIAVVFALILHYTKTIGKPTTRKRVHELKVNIMYLTKHLRNKHTKWL